MNDLQKIERRIWRLRKHRSRFFYKDDASPFAKENLQSQISRLQRENRYLRRSFEALVRIVQSLGNNPGVETLFKYAVDPIQEITGYSVFALRLYDAKTGQFILKAHKGFTPYMVQVLQKLPRSQTDVDFLTKMVQTRHAVNYDVPEFEDSEFHNVVFVPLLGNDKIVGSLDLGSKIDLVWSENELAWLELVGRYMGIIISHIQLSEQLEGLSIIQEREYIARELHDDTLQAISAMILWAQETQMDIDENRLPAAIQGVQKIEQSANLAYNNLREEIFGLRRNIGVNEDILTVLHTLLESFEMRWGISTTLYVDFDEFVQNIAPLPARTETQVLRIIQETLTNVRKHADATSITLNVSITEDNLVFIIQDNGKGFNPLVVTPDHFGLRIMKERAASLGGTVVIDSHPGDGSTIHISIPW